jgi:hypothetical protein
MGALVLRTLSLCRSSLAQKLQTLPLQLMGGLRERIDGWAPSFSTRMILVYLNSSLLKSPTATRSEWSFMRWAAHSMGNSQFSGPHSSGVGHYGEDPSRRNQNGVASAYRGAQRDPPNHPARSPFGNCGALEHRTTLLEGEASGSTVLPGSSGKARHPR